MLLRNKLRLFINNNTKILVVYAKQHGLNLENHCIRRIAYDNAVGDCWFKLVGSPFMRHADINQISKVHNLMCKYMKNIDLLISHNEISLEYRKQYKQSVYEQHSSQANIC